jgi:hypothetical protein
MCDSFLGEGEVGVKSGVPGTVADDMSANPIPLFVSSQTTMSAAFCKLFVRTQTAGTINF